VGGDA